jgi:hypothetical protein
MQRIRIVSGYLGKTEMEAANPLPPLSISFESGKTLKAVSIKIEFDTPQFLQGLFANDRRNLAYLEEALELKTVTRDGWIAFTGSEKSTLLRGGFSRISNPPNATASTYRTATSGSPWTSRKNPEIPR